ncbi:DUF7284 family protein [Halobacterium noricense]|uniref:DUF7284 family protein n=1 Tax=Halobacterium noricense TaxID=223182 RepID=UPI001E5128D8|nr:hypothetical protein [Halobacterium noricense]UHH25747.1 hypothetical protein LT974_02155 [Halobacterium noricense]
MSRAISTVLDASLAVLLVSAAAVALVTIPGSDQRPPDPDAAARTVLASTTTAEYQTANGSERSVSGRVGTLLAHAAVADNRSTNSRFASAVEDAVADVLADANGRIAIAATGGGGTVRVGERPPPSASVAAVSHEAVAENDSVTITVRTWSA